MVVKNVAVIGECMIEMKKIGSTYTQSFGGDTLNTAVYFSRLTKDDPINTYYYTGLGQDKFSHDMLKQWQGEGLHTQHVAISEHHIPGLYIIETAPDGERQFLYWRQHSAAKYWLESVDIASLQQQFNDCAFIYLSGISLAILPESSRQKLFSLLSNARQNGSVIIFDNNYRPSLWPSVEVTRNTYQTMLSLTDIAFLTLEDETALYGNESLEEVITRSQAMGVNEIIIKRGAQPCVVVIDQQRIEVAASKVAHVIDTTAAGDSFSAAYLASRLKGNSAEQSAQHAHLLAGKVIQYHGAIIPQHDMPEI
ncbi:sugar kinase [Enterobacteriaceae bacterium ESL0689]|nr:sugar kinase [Enterobacteriaceae bacterium ESL0689]